MPKPTPPRKRSRTAHRVVNASCRAMATMFEIAVWGRDDLYLRTVAEEALAEIGRIEQQLSIYRDDSDVFDLNCRAAREPVPVDPRIFRILKRAKELSEISGGAFDITVGPLLRAWGFIGGSGHLPDPDAISAASKVVGMDLVELDEERYTVQYAREGVMIDLGAIGKGYAIEQAADMLRDYEVGGGLIHGGTSTVQAIGAQPDGAPWQIAIRDPRCPDEHLGVVSLTDMALSISAVHGKFFDEGDARFGHVLDPRTGQPTQGALLAAVSCPSATETDALSTALLVLKDPFFDTLAARPETGGMVFAQDPVTGGWLSTCGTLADTGIVGGSD